MCYGKNGTVFKLFKYFLLDKSICFRIDIGSSFIENKNFGFPNNSPGEANELLLAHREKTGTLGAVSIQTVREIGNLLFQIDVLNDFLDLLFSLLSERI